MAADAAVADWFCEDALEQVLQFQALQASSTWMMMAFFIEDGDQEMTEAEVIEKDALDDYEAIMLDSATRRAEHSNKQAALASSHHRFGD